MLALLSVGVIKGNIITNYSVIYMPVIIIALGAIFSAIFSEYKNVSIFGFPERYEGLLAILAYLMLFMAAYLLLNEPEKIKALLACMIASSVVICLCGIFQFAGMDPLKTPIAKNILLSGLAEKGSAVLQYANNADIQYGNAIYGTLFNSNTFGFYMAMLFPFSLALALTVGKRLYLILSLLYSCLTFACLLGSYSRGAYAGAAAGAIFTVSILLIKKVFNWKRFSILLISFIPITSLMIFQSDGGILQRFESLITPGNFKHTAVETDKIREIYLKGNRLYLFTEKTELRAIVQENSLSFNDENERPLDLAGSASQSNTYIFTDERYNGYTIQISDNVLNIMKDKSFLLFGIDKNMFLPLDSKGRVINIEQIESFGFEGMERFASGRGYIWSRSLPLLKKTLLIGHGPDTYALYFPQNDYFGKLKFLYDANIFVDKPHNMYLQIAINLGCPALLALLFLLFIFFHSCVKVCSVTYASNSILIYSLLICAAIPGYLIAGLFTDSNMSTAPVFWILFGACIGFNQRILKSRQPAQPAAIETSCPI
jgi:O-antigen ligase